MKNKSLHNIKSPGYQMPDGYLESLESEIFSKLSEDTIASNVQTTGFKVPTDYFETVEGRILRETEKESKTIPLYNWKKVAYVSGIAASIILAINLFVNNSTELTMTDIDTASIENYLMDENINAYDIAPYFNSMDLTSEDFVETKVNTSDIEAYLLQNSDFENLISD